MEWCQGLGSAELRQSQTKFRLTEPNLIQQLWVLNVPRCEKTGLRGFRPGRAVTVQLNCVFVFAHAKSRFSHTEAQMVSYLIDLCFRDNCNFKMHNA